MEDCNFQSESHTHDGEVVDSVVFVELVVIGENFALEHGKLSNLMGFLLILRSFRSEQVESELFHKI